MCKPTHRGGILLIVCAIRIDWRMELSVSIIQSRSKLVRRLRVCKSVFDFTNNKTVQEGVKSSRNYRRSAPGHRVGQDGTKREERLKVTGE